MRIAFPLASFFVLMLLPTARAADRVSFAKEIAPIFEHRCLRCHKPGNRRGRLSLTTEKDLKAKGLIVAGNPEKSELVQVVTAQGKEAPAMPKEGKPLTKGQVSLLRRWIAQGAVWPKGLVLKQRSKADRTFWSLQRLSEVQPPVVSDARWSRHPIDRFIFAKLASQGMAPNPRADRRSLLRRATYDLTGLPPTPEEVEAFLNDRSPDAYEKLIDRLLASPRYGERWGRHWLDVVRFGESNGFERNVIISTLWPFRDYVIRSLNDDKPFDRMVLEHLAGDVLGKGNPDVEVGTAFLVCGPYDNVGNQDPKQQAQIRANTIDEMIRATSEAFLGLTVGCARCHDHKFDPITQTDYYSLYATFAGTFHGEREIVTAEARQKRDAILGPLKQKLQKLEQQQVALLEKVFERARTRMAQYRKQWKRPSTSRIKTVDAFAPVRASAVRLVVEALDSDPNRSRGFRIDEFEAWTAAKDSHNVALASNGGQATGASRIAEDFAEAYSPRLAIDGKLGERWLSTGNSLTVRFAKPEVINRVVFSSDRLGSLATISKNNGITTFIGEYRLEASENGKNWTVIASSKDRLPSSPAHAKRRLIQLEITPEEKRQKAKLAQEQARLKQQMAQVKPLPNWWAGQFRKAPGPFHLFLGGSPERKGPLAFPASLEPLREVTRGYRLPATAPESERRMALAKWIIASDNPLTPRTLANRLWHYHFGAGIVSSPSDLGYMGGRPSHLGLLDWLARQIQRFGWRLKAMHRLIMLSEAYRQSSRYRPEAAKKDGSNRLLWRYSPRRLSAEEIRDTILAISGKLNLQMGGPGFRLYRYLQDNVATYVPLDHPGPETYRRAVYHQNARAAPVDLMADFDCPDNAFAAPRRATTTTPLQALTLMNHRFTRDMAKALAERVKREAGDDPKRQVHRLLALSWSRPPRPEEAGPVLRFIERHGLEPFCRALLNTNELIYLD